MALALSHSVSMGFAGAAAPRLVTPVAASSVAMGIADLEKIGKEQNPLIG